jgi:hypothetical protein
MAVNRPTSSETDVSDIRPDSGNNGQVSPTQLPIRGEKRVIPVPLNPATLSDTFQQVRDANGQPSTMSAAPRTDMLRPYAPGSPRTALVEESDFYVTAAMKPFVDYIAVRLQHRGIETSKNPNGNLPAVYRFLINPSQVAVSRTTIDGQAMTRAGWQIGVWGEDAFQVTLTGKTAGQYFAFGVTDRFQRFSESYRNLEQLQMVFENNGYWFEGEQAAEGPLAADFARRRIKMHADVELIVGNFIWSGMFDTLTITQSADTPWLIAFNIVFTVWKERFRTSSPYGNQIMNDVQRGHSFTAFAASPISADNGVPMNASTSIFKLLPPNIPPYTAPPLEPVSPALTSAQNNSLLPQNDPMAVDSTPMSDVQNRKEAAVYSFWQNGLGPVQPPPVNPARRVIL